MTNLFGIMASEGRIFVSLLDIKEGSMNIRNHFFSIPFPHFVLYYHFLYQSSMLSTLITYLKSMRWTYFLWFPQSIHFVFNFTNFFSSRSIHFFILGALATNAKWQRRAFRMVSEWQNRIGGLVWIVVANSSVLLHRFEQVSTWIRLWSKRNMISLYSFRRTEI